MYTSCTLATGQVNSRPLSMHASSPALCVCWPFEPFGHIPVSIGSVHCFPLYRLRFLFHCPAGALDGRHLAWNVSALRCVFARTACCCPRSTRDAAHGCCVPNSGLHAGHRSKPGSTSQVGCYDRLLAALLSLNAEPMFSGTQTCSQRGPTSSTLTSSRYTGL